MSDDDNESDEHEPVDISDPWSKLQPVLAGHDPKADGYKISDVVSVFPVRNTERNLWELHVHEVNTVTFDADAFVTTADLGMYINGVLEGLEQGVAEQRGELDDDPRPTGPGGGKEFQ
ncbi:hypothetical protein GJ633_09330 [Halorubrum sp. CBA1125]|uniref:hypothetical protein n=1 Tax=Halorubrum sp. CBA1125 TaxID=2668072 RepID=UPI0012E86430|nr:hypothetical protein [Halorubrum sp. CBA1125]MUW14841.1 hypothetical protein [Halorubrum sp. CBA1125]